MTKKKIDFNRNNLDKSSSIYLQQHKNNPINWQEWNEDVINYAKKENKILFVSVGYSTCHWCHVMAQESFSNQEIADYLNKYFVSIKVDREVRPDIDKYLMNFLLSFSGHGGWPLNVFLTPNVKPFYGLTYASTYAKFNMPGFLEILFNVQDHFQKINQIVQDFKIPFNQEIKSKLDNIVGLYAEYFDDKNFGFIGQNKFPPHCTLIFLMHYYEETKDEKIKNILEKTLDIMMRSGLHDHLQGGFFRYCVDEQWQIPHFEKMLYDQAMLIWVYSSAFKIFNKAEYEVVVEKIVKCLNETYEHDNLYYSAHDADTNHKEGETYLWDHKELKDLLSPEEFEIVIKNYEISKEGNFEGKNHLIKKHNVFPEDLINVEAILLNIRKKREQPIVDTKIITSWNCLTGISLIHAYRYLNNNNYLTMAKKLFNSLIKNHYYNKKLIHSSIKEDKNNNEFLEDYSSMLLFITYLEEETKQYKNQLNEFYDLIQKFKKNNHWLESMNKDFLEVQADNSDHPTPSSISMAELAIIRYKILFNQEYFEITEFNQPLMQDFVNITDFIKNGYFHIIENPKKLTWDKLPINTIQKHGDKFQDCYKGTCIESTSILQKI